MTIRCTGECCERVVLSCAGRHLTSVEDLDDDDAFRPLARLIDVVPADDQTGAPAYGRFGCAAWDPQTRRCTVYDQRPDMCRCYPTSADGCHFCGAQSHEDAVAIPEQV